ncbi:acyltransferase family protein [Mucilaginibacter ginkgonis]|nr:acyltransferase [Mucilaginibacter ginkgonis]
MYGAPGGWYYKEPTMLKAALIPMTVLVSTDQSFFMGFFFFISAAFTYSSLKRKGWRRFLTDRLIRLGLPLIFYSFVFSPFLIFLIYRYGENNHASFFQFLGGFHDWIDFGVLWFVAALLLFTVVCVALHRTFDKMRIGLFAVPKLKVILCSALLIGLISFIIRIPFPVGWVLHPLGFQPGHFTQYIFLFIMGIIAAKNDWLKQFSENNFQQFWRTIKILLCFFPVFFLIQTGFHLPMVWYSGGFNVLSLLYSAWEQCIGFCIISAMLIFGKQHWNFSTPTVSFLSQHAFAVYIFHPLALISIALLLRPWSADPGFKLLIAAPIGVAGSILLAILVRLIPSVKRII